MEFCVITDIKNGIGNILSEILVGLFFSKKLSLITGENYNYYGLLTDKCFNGHEIVYNKDHHNSQLPHPLNLSAIFPQIDFLVRLPNNMVNFHYLCSVDIQRLRAVKRLNIRVDSITQILFELADNKDILERIIFNDKITQYTSQKYTPTNKSLAIHVRVRQMGDYMYVNLPDVEWYKNSVDEYIRLYGRPDKIFLITGISTAENKQSTFKDEILSYLKSLNEVSKSEEMTLRPCPNLVTLNSENINVIDVLDEPYYVDMSLLSMSGSKIITNSSFSLFASFIDLTNEKRVFYPDCLAKEFKLGDHIILPNFVKLP